MKLLTEVLDIDELNRVKILFESKGIPLFIGNEDSARNMGLIIPARKYAVFVLHETQFQDAQRLLHDENHVVENPVDMDEHRESMELIRPQAGEEMVKGVLKVGAIVVAVFAAVVWFMSTID